VLSAGRQLVALARAFLAYPAVLMAASNNAHHEAAASAARLNSVDQA
jgi:predicted ABC-type transport system involved in lysophospholipase L1 biosynthesis ATPase subunit